MVGLPFFLILQYINSKFSVSTRVFQIRALVTRIAKASTQSFDIDSFRHPTLSNKEHLDGCKLGIDSWADTCCAGKHAYVEEFVEGKTVTATGFTSTLGSISNLPIANVLYAYDAKDGSVIILECNNSIYMGGKMGDSLVNPIQAEEHDVRIDIRPRSYYPNSTTAQSITFSDGTILDVLYDGVLPYIPIRRPTKEEVHHCRRLEITSRDSWDPFLFSGSFSSIAGTITDSTQMYLERHIDDVDPIGANLMSLELASLISTPILQAPASTLSDFDITYSSINKIESRRKSILSPEELSKRLNIGLPTAKRTLLATTHQCIRSTGLLARRFKTDRSQLRYKQLARGYGTFYTNYLKASCKSL